MKKVLSLLAMLIVCCSAHISAQVFTPSPSPLQESSKNVVITFHADKQDVKGLQNLPSTTPLYTHIGVFTTKSPSIWSYVKTDWAVNTEETKFKYVSANTYELNIGDIRTYFGITDPNETVTHICIIARTADGSVQTKDNFIEVKPGGFQMTFNHSEESTIISEPTTVTFNVTTTEDSKIDLTVNGTSIANVANGTSLSKAYTFSTKGTYEVKAVANNGTETKEESITFIYMNAAVQQNYPGGVPKMGAVENADGTVTFCLAAPGKKSVILVPSWDDYQTLDKNVMKYQDYNGNRYFWTTVSGLDPNKEYPYYYVVDATIKVGDPYAKLVLDPYSDKWLDKNVYPGLINYPFEKGLDGIMLAVYKGTRDNYNWKVKNFVAPDKKDLIIYEMLFRDFTGTEGKADGNGTIRDAIAKIPYIKALGVNAVELMPIMEFDGNNSWGYNTNFYFAPDKAYGTPDDYREFIDLCHQNGIAVILDIVFNQSAGLHPWYQMYPISSNPFYNEEAPHAYSVLNDWKQDNALVQQQWKDALKYWMTAYKVDGFRFDLVKGLGNNSSYGGDTEKYNQSRVDNMKALHAAMKEVNPNAYHINEHLAGFQEENAMAADGQMNWANVSNASCQFAMGFSSGADCNRFMSTNDSRTWASTVSYAESHDEERMGYKQQAYATSTYIKGNHANSMKRLGSLAAQMLLAPGAHMIWQFGELGADQTTKSADGGNDTSPKKVIWSYLDDDDRKGLHKSYTELCHLRKDNPDMFTSTSLKVMSCNSANWANGRFIRLENGNKEIVCVINPNVTGTRPYTMAVSKLNASNYQILSCSHGIDPQVTFSGSNVSIKVPAHCYVVIGTKDIVGVEGIIADNTSNINVFGANGEIIIEGEYENVAVYSVTGQKYSTLKVPAGVYVVNIDGNCTKVLVK